MSLGESAAKSWIVATVAAVLVAATLATFWPVTRQGFINIDDNAYVADNPRVREGLSWRGVVWAFSYDRAMANWHPVTWLSHQLDVSLFGLRPGRHHLVSLLLHATNALLMFLIFRHFTGALWPSAAVAALFALHPLHVESVAWIAERKDVLATFFWLLTLAAWLRHLRRPTAATSFATPVLFALSLMAKPMGVTFPFVLLLLDWWPLGRWRLGKRLVREKLPLFVLSAGAGVIAFVTQSAAGAVGQMALLPFPVRLANAVVTYVAYLGKMVWPSRLAIYYPHPGEGLPWWRPALAALLLATLTMLAVREARRRPWLATGWLWYAGTLVPVIGLVQVGAQAMADRYTYIPLVGVFIAVAWEAAGLVHAHPRLRPAAAALGALAVAALVWLTGVQVALWRDNRTLFMHALTVTSGNFQAHIGLGIALSKEGKKEEAIAQYREALRLRPEFPTALKNLSRELAALGRLGEAERYAREVVRLEPDRAAPLNELGSILERRGRSAEAIALYEASLKLEPGQGLVHNNLALILEETGRVREAVEEYQRALRLEPGSSEFNNNLGVALAGLGEMRRAAEHFEIALQLDPNNESARKNRDLAMRVLDLRRSQPEAR